MKRLLGKVLDSWITTLLAACAVGVLYLQLLPVEAAPIAPVKPVRHLVIKPRPTARASVEDQLKAATACFKVGRKINKAQTRAMTNADVVVFVALCQKFAMR